jgi:hypothetical protein
MNQCTLTLAFLKPTPLDPIVNRITAGISTYPICHVELYFETINQCFSIVCGELAGFRSKNLSNPNYTLVSLGVTPKEYRDCLEYCVNASKQNLSFDDWGMWVSYFKIRCTDNPSMHAGQTFCSKIITEALQFGFVAEVDTLRASLTTPSRLLFAIKDSRRRVCSSVPFKRQRMLLEAVICPLVMHHGELG